MGKAEKIKEQRQIARAEKTLKKKKRIKLFLVGLTIGSVSLMAALAGSWVYQKLGTKTNNNQTKEKKVYTEAPAMQIDTNKTYIAKFETSMGNFEAQLYAKDAPKTVNNFVVLSRDGFYDNLIFHRIIKDFMIQGGDPEGTGMGGPGYEFEDEINGHKLVRGTLAMANSGPNTNGSQFFIVTKDKTDWLDGKHTPFGEITSGLDVVMNIEKVEVDANSKPLSPVTIKKITIEEK